MESNISFRDFEERDIEFVWKCKNDEELNKMIVGQFKPFTYEDAKKWVYGCMGEHDTFKFWAICTNDEQQRIIGWLSLSEIDRINQSVSTHSIVIGDTDYNDGITWIESVLFMLEYSFEKLKFNRVYGVSLVGHKMSNIIGNLMFMQTEGILRQAIFKNGQYYDLQYVGIIKDEYFSHKDAGDYEMKNIIRRLRKLRHE